MRTLDIGGKSAKFDVILPYSSFSANGLVAGRPREREMSGLGDPRFRLSINLLGAPALSAQEFANYQQDLIVGASLQVSAPLGQYDDTKLLNLGNNRWSFRPELGISKAWGPWTVEVAPSVTFFTDNTDFFGDRTLSQAPIYAVRGDIVYHFESGVWVSLDGTYFTGGRTTDKWRERRQRAIEHARRPNACDTFGSPKLGEIQRKYRNLDPHRKRVQCLRCRLAASLVTFHTAASCEPSSRARQVAARCALRSDGRGHTETGRFKSVVGSAASVCCARQVPRSLDRPYRASCRESGWSWPAVRGRCAIGISLGAAQIRRLCSVDRSNSLLQRL